jgi:hypothetical protein
MKNLGLLLLPLLLWPRISHGDEDSAAGFSPPPAQGEGWVALPHGRPFGILPSDPRDLKLALRGNNKKEIEADVGGYRSLAGWRKEGCVFHVGIEGGAFFQMRKEGSNFPLHSSDGLIGLYAETAREHWAYQLRFTHISAHLSDGLTPVRQRILYTREFVALRAARQLGWFRAYAGYQALVHTKPDLPRHSLQLGGYAYLPWHWGIAHPYLGGDLRVRGKEEGTTFQLGAGAALVSSSGMPPVRLTATYLKGHDLRGQFYLEPTEKWAFGLDLDL